MTRNLPAVPAPSLASVFEPHRAELRAALLGQDLSAARVVTLTRKALDAAGASFTDATSDVQLQKAGLWLIEMVKSGAGTLDSGASAEVVWQEVPARPALKIGGTIAFYAAALGFSVAALYQGSRLTLLAVAALAVLRLFDPSEWKRALSRLKFWKKAPSRIEGPDGKAFLADARITVDSSGFIDGIADSLRTADHILLRLAEPMPEARWIDDPKMLSLMQNLLEAQGSGDGEFALRLIETELSSVLRSEGIEAVDYTGKHKRLFDVLPGLDMDGGDRTAAPALLSGDQVLRRGTVWNGES